MNERFFKQLVEQSAQGQTLSSDTAHAILSSPEVKLLPLLQAAFELRKKYCGMSVKIHIINNVQNGHCSEDCSYCAQAKTSQASISEYPLKSDEEILAEAKMAYENGAFRYCMVFSGRSLPTARIQRLAELIKAIKRQYAIEVCVSPGRITVEEARILKAAGLNRLNHNINTSRRNYPRICTTHSFDDRLQTLQACRQAGLEICSGVIIGLGEGAEDILEMAKLLGDFAVESIPVNFFIPIPGLALPFKPDFSPEYCLRVLCLFRFLNPRAEIRIAAGRELYLKSMEVMALYPANSLFLNGYLNAKGSARLRTLAMIKEAGFTIESDRSLDELINREQALRSSDEDNQYDDQIIIKTLQELRPQTQQMN